MKRFIFPENLNVKKRMADLRISVAIDEWTSTKRAVSSLLIKAVAMGGSPNVIKQMNLELTDEDYKFIHETERKIFELSKEIYERLEPQFDSIKVENHKFH